MTIFTSDGKQYEDELNLQAGVPMPEEDANTVAAKRVKQSVKPEGGRAEGGITTFLEGIGNDVARSLNRPKQLVNSLMQKYNPDGVITTEDIQPEDVAAGIAFDLMSNGVLHPSDGIGIFGGKMGAARAGKTATIDSAEDALQAGKQQPIDVFRDTGVFEGPDGKLRFEINDKSARLKKPVFADTLGDMLDHPTLYKAYPELKDIKMVGMGEYEGKAGGWYDDSVNSMAIQPGMSDENTLGVILHEAQHAIQDIEGFAKGSNPKSWISDLHSFKTIENHLPVIEKAVVMHWNTEVLPDLEEFAKRNGIDHNFISPKNISAYLTENNTSKEAQLVMGYLEKNHPEFIENFKIAKQAPPLLKTVEDEAREHYMKTYGEVEARIVQERMDMNPLERRMYPPWDGPTMSQAYPDNVIDQKYLIK